MSASDWLAAVAPPELRETLVTIDYGSESSCKSVGAQAVAARRTVGTQTGSGPGRRRCALVGLSVCALLLVALVASASCHAAGMAGCAIGTAAAVPRRAAAEVEALQRKLTLLEAESAGLVAALEQAASLLSTPGAVPTCATVAGHWAQSWGSDVTEVTQDGCRIRARNPSQWWRSAKGVVSGHVVKMFGLEGVVSRNVGSSFSTIGWTNGAVWTSIDNTEETSRKEPPFDGEQFPESLESDTYAGEFLNYVNGTICSSICGCSQ